MKVSHDWLKDYIGNTIPSPEEIERLLTFRAFEVEGIEAVEGDTVIDVDVLPNRSSDCLCHRGIAREIASVTNTPLVHDPLAEKPQLAATDKIVVDIEDTQACPRFTASLITGIEIKESPEWLQRRLRAIGQRPINNIVDATNYVMFAIGQPIHAYDADLFPQKDGVWQFGVRHAREGEVVSLIAEGGKNEDRDVTLTGGELLIVDRSTDTPIGLAGVKGGRFAGVHEGTKSVIIEAAHFDPIRTRKTARGLGIVIDASRRFENEPSRALPPYAQQEIVRLITEIAGGLCEGGVDVYPVSKENQEVCVRPERVNALLGLSLSRGEMSMLLMRVGCAVRESGEGILVTGPFERTDLTIEEDFIEEIGRVYGYEHVLSVVPEAVPLLEMNARHYYGEKVREKLIDLGFSEVITSSFRKKDAISLLNALASDKGCLRSSLRKNIEEVLDRNIRHVDLLGVSGIGVFEIGTVFEKGEGAVTEHVSLCIGVRSKVTGVTKADDEKLGAALSELEAELGVALTGTNEQGVFEMNFTELVTALPVPDSYDPVGSGGDTQYKPFSPYPFVARDIALWVGSDIVVDEVAKVLDENAGDLRVRTTLFDEFTKGGRTSYAFRLVFQSNERTLTDSDVNSIMDTVYTALAEKGWEVR